MDSDESKKLTEQELIDSYDHIPEFREMLVSMEVQRQDLSQVFRIIDLDNSGSVHYDVFVVMLHRMKSMDMRMLLFFTKLETTNTNDGVRDLTSLVRDQIWAWKVMTTAILDALFAQWAFGTG